MTKRFLHGVTLALAMAVVLAARADAQEQPHRLITGTGGQACAAVPVGPGGGTVSFDVTGTWVGTLTFYVEALGGTRNVLDVAKADTPGTFVNTTTANGAWSGSVASYSYGVICFTSYTSGTADVSLKVGAGGGTGGGGGGGGGGGAVTAGDGDIATIGTTTDSAATAGGAGTLTAQLRRITTQLAGTLTVTGGGGGTQYMQDGALTVATTVGTMAMGRASAAAPTDVGSDNDAVIPWYLRSGAQATQLTFGGALASAGNGASGTGVQRVTLANDSTGVVNVLFSGTAPDLGVGTGGSATLRAILDDVNGSDLSAIATATQATATALGNTALSAAEDNPIGDAPDLVPIAIRAKAFTGSAFSTVSAADDYVRPAASLFGVQYVTLTGEDGSKTPIAIEDVAVPAAGAGLRIFFKQCTTAASSGADGDFVDPCTTSAGELWVRDTNSAAALTALQLIDNIPNTLGSTTSGQSGVLSLGAVTTSAPTYTNGQTNAISLDTSGAVRVAITSGAGSGGTSIADDATFTTASTSLTPVGGQYKSTRDSVDDNDAGVFAMNQKRGLYVSPESPNGDSLANDTVDALKVVNSTVGDATIYLTARLTDGTNFVTPDTQATQDAALGTITSVTGGQNFCRASAAAPTDVSADNDSSLFWCLRSGALAIQPSYAGTLASTGNGASGGGVPRVTIANDSTGVLATVSTVTSLSQFAGQAIALNTGAASAGTLRATLATDDNLSAITKVDDAAFTPATSRVAVIGFQADETATDSVDEGDAGAPRMTLDRIAFASPAAVTASTQATTGCYLQSAASTNATNCKNAAGNFYGFRATNTTTTVYYLRLYNTSSAPTCSSATGYIESIPIPPASAAGQVGGYVWQPIYPVNYGTGISFCLTGGASSTDNTNAATGLQLALQYK